MGNKHQDRRPHNQSNEQWWYEDPKGITMVHQCKHCKRTTVLKTLTWRAILGALKRRWRGGVARRESG